MHPLTPLLAPRSIALVGASPRENAPGRDMLLTLRRGGFTGPAYAVNPKYQEVEGFPCFPSLAALPEAVDLAVLSLPNAALEEGLKDAVAAGARAAAIFASAQVPSDPALPQRLAAVARAARLPICGVNCMGFYNDESATWICGFPSQRQRRPGHIALIAQSGSVFGALAHNDPRFKFNLVVSPGSELVTSAADYMDYALSLESTRVIGLFLESVRDPATFVAALERAERQGVPVVVLKVGRTDEARQLAISHTGAMTGDDAAFDALCRRHGVARVSTLDELGATLLLFANGRPAAPGGLASIHDSGGEREMLVDLAAEVGVPFGRIGEATRARLAERLDPGLEPHNPLDAWGTGADFVSVFTDCFQALADDPDTGAAVLFSDVRDNYYISEGFIAAALAVSQRTAKPVAVVPNFSGVRHDELSLRLTEAGLPVLDGTLPGLQALKHLFAWRDHLARPAPQAPAAPAGRREKWRARLAEPRVLSEAEGLALLADYGLPTVGWRSAGSAEEVRAAVAALGAPVAVKSAAPGLHHKSDAGGVLLNLDGEGAVAAWQSLAERLGPAVLVQAMAPRGAEFVLGMKRDPQFGPLILVGAGGILVELLGDAQAALAPLDAAGAEALLGRLKAARLLEGLRGGPPLARGALVEALVALASLALDLDPLVAEIDINPLIVHETGALAVDALVVPSALRS